MSNPIPTEEVTPNQQFQPTEDGDFEVDYKQNEDELVEQENRSEAGDEDLNDGELESARTLLVAEIAELEWEFKQAKESLYNERVAQVDAKVEQARSGNAPELMHIVKLIEDGYRMRHQVAKHRKELAAEVARNTFESERITADCIAGERMQQMEEQIRLRLQESLCRLQIERAASVARHDIPELHLPGPNLVPRKKPVSLSPTAPRLVYQLSPEDIQADVEAIMAAVKGHKLKMAMSEMNGGRLVY